MQNNDNNIKLYDMLHNTMRRAKTGTKFKQELEEALAQGFPVDFTPKGGSPLLHLSLEYACPDVITQLLLKVGADVNIINADGKNALLVFCAVFNEWRYKDNPEIFMEILEKTTDVNKVPTNENSLMANYTALSNLCITYSWRPSQETIDAIKLMLDRGANPDIGDEWWISNDSYVDISENGKKLKKIIYNYLEQREESKTSADSGYEYEL